MDVYAEATEQKKQESFERLAAKLDIFLSLKKRSDGALKMTAKSLNDSKLTTNEGK